MAAVTFAQPSTRPNDHSTAFYPQYTLTGEPSPESSQAGTPASYSPNNTRANYHGLPPHLTQQPRQLRPSKCPMYTPAVLRPTERPARSSPPKQAPKRSGKLGAGPLTPPSSAGGSFDDTVVEEDDEEVLRRVLEDGMAQSGISRIVTDEWKDRALENVTGLPTRDHWKPDEASPNCDASPCALPFSTFRRRHHCRRCGKIFCSTHCAHFVPLDQHARFHPQGAQGRACDSCWKDFGYWDKARLLRANGSFGGSNSKGGSSDASGVVTPTVAAAAAVGQGSGNANGNGSAIVDMKQKNEHVTADGKDKNAVVSVVEDAVANKVAEEKQEKQEKKTQQQQQQQQKGKSDGFGRGSGEMATSSSYANNWNWSTF